jgi:hypothetical protein
MRHVCRDDFFVPGIHCAGMFAAIGCDRTIHSSGPSSQETMGARFEPQSAASAAPPLRLFRGVRLPRIKHPSNGEVAGLRFENGRRDDISVPHLRSQTIAQRPRLTVNRFEMCEQIVLRSHVIHFRRAPCIPAAP